MRHPLIRKGEDAVLEAARSGDAQAFEHLIADHWPSLHAHSYRMLGSRHDADDALQEVLIRAWRAIPRFEGRSSIRTWLYRIATNTCLDLIARRRRRAAALESESSGRPAGRPTEVPLTDDTLPERHPVDPLTPQVRYEQREAVELAFIAALQHLPSRPRAALILRDVLGFTAREAADLLNSSPAAVNSALQRARAALESRNLDPSLLGTRRAVRQSGPADAVERFVDALERDDLEAIVESLRVEVGRNGANSN
jgi:RNA polymerase sigma-70 factor (ECF subfamily)